jgi:hypothetical protein
LALLRRRRLRSAALGRAAGDARHRSDAILTCGAEDLIVFKAFAGRDGDWLDIAGVVARQGPKLDRRVIWDELLPLLELKGTPEHADRLRSLLQEK